MQLRRANLDEPAPCGYNRACHQGDDYDRPEQCRPSHHAYRLRFKAHRDRRLALKKRERLFALPEGPEKPPKRSANCSANRSNQIAAYFSAVETPLKVVLRLVP